jgi:hypothetical protein
MASEKPLSNFIADGQDFPFFIKARPPYYAELRGRFRPLSPRIQTDWNTRAARMGGDELADYEFQTVAQQLVSWVTTPARTISVEALEKLHPEQWLRLRDIICYATQADPDPSTRSLPETAVERVDETKKN